MTTIDDSVAVRESMQELRIKYGNVLGAIERGTMVASPDTVLFYETWRDRFAQYENYAEVDIAIGCEDVEIIEIMTRVKGIGTIFAARLYAGIDITIPDTASALWRYCGMGVTDGKADRPTKGEKIKYNPKMKTLMFNIAQSFLKSRSPYRAIYDNKKAYYEENRPDWTKARIHYASMRVMVKVFLFHLWEQWRILEGLPTRVPYPIEYTQHTSLHKAEDFGW